MLLEKGDVLESQLSCESLVTRVKRVVRVSLTSLKRFLFDVQDRLTSVLDPEDRG